MTTDDRPEQPTGTPGAPASGPDRTSGTSGSSASPAAPAGPAGPAAPDSAGRMSGPAVSRPASGDGAQEPSGGSGPSGPAGGHTTAAPRAQATAKTPDADAVDQAEDAVDADGSAVASTAADVPGAEGDEPGITELGAGAGEGGERGVRRRPPVLVAAVVAAVLVVGGGAYLGASALGRDGGSAGAGASGTPGVLTLDGYGGSGTGGVAPGEPNPYGAAYRASGTLPDGPGSAPVYRAEGEIARSDVARLAKALGVDGTPVAEGQEWQVGPGKDGTGPSLRVSTTAPGIWTFSRYAPGTDGCGSGSGSGTDRCSPAIAPSASSATPVSESAAERAAAPVLKALGQDDATVDASQIMGAQRAVNADPVVGGLPTDGWTTGLIVNAQGEVAGGSGRLKAPVRGDSYPVLSAKKTLDLMNAAPGSDHRMGIGGCASPVPLKDRLEAPCGTTASTPAAPAATAVVEKAVFGLAARSSGGRQVLVPSWLFEVRESGRHGDTSTVACPAVDPRYLASSVATAQPSPRPTGTATGGARTRDIAVEGYRADGRALTVSFTGGVCATYRTTAAEDSGKVTVTVTETTKPGTMCVMIAEFYRQTVRLDRPLGDRRVVGSDGREIPPGEPGTRVPAPSPPSASAPSAPPAAR